MSATNPVVVEVWRGGAVESRHRGAWALARGDGTVLAGAGDLSTPIHARSSIKALQVLPLLETGAAERFAFDAADLALCVSSHNAEPCHTERAAAMLARLGLGVEDLRCGAHPPGDPEARRALAARGREPTALHNNCSGKHAGFLALAVHLGLPTEHYLEPESEGQLRVRSAVGELCDLAPAEIGHAIDGCSAPTFLLSLRSLATAYARFATPERLAGERPAHCRRLADAVAEHPRLIAGNHRRLCTDIARATGGRLFPKIGAEGVYVIGVRGADRGLAVKIDDGGKRGLHALVLALIERLRLADEIELERLAPWRERTRKNHRGIEVGRIEACLP